MNGTMGKLQFETDLDAKMKIFDLMESGSMHKISQTFGKQKLSRAVTINQTVTAF